MFRLILASMISGSMIISFVGCTTLAGATGDTPTERANADFNLPEYNGIKHAIGVREFENQAGWKGHWELGDNLALMLESALFDTDRFVLVDRENLDDVIKEQDLQASGRMAKASKVAQTGKIRPARYIATGAITTVDDTSGGGGGIGIPGTGLRVGVGGNKAQVTAICKLIDTTTGEIVAKERITGKPGGLGISVGYYGSSLSGDLGGFTKTPIGEAAQDVINQAAVFFAKSMEEIPFEGSVIKVTGKGQVIINRGADFNIENGAELVMAEKGEELVDPDTGALLGYEEGEEIGRLKIVKVADKVSYADVISGEKKPDPGTTVQLK